MINSLIIYSSTDGHTKTICKKIANFLKDGDIVKIISLDESIPLMLEISYESWSPKMRRNVLTMILVSVN